MAKMGRKLIEIDWKIVDNMCKIHCTQEEIASVLEVSIDTLTRASKRERGMTFAELIKIKSKTGKASLRRYQWNQAKRGNTAILIWLGKQYLNQADTPPMDENELPEGFDIDPV